MRKREAKNNNLQKYREKLLSKNEALVRDAIAHITGLGGEVSFSSVSKVTYDLALKDGEKGLTLAAISKNSLYRALVEEAQANSQISKGSIGGSTHRYSPGDMQVAIHALRVENANLKEANKLLTLKLKEVPERIETVQPISDSIIKQSNALHGVARSMVNRMCELEIAYIDTETNSLKLAMYDDIIVREEALNLFYKKELNEIRTKIHRDASNDQHQ